MQNAEKVKEVHYREKRFWMKQDDVLHSICWTCEKGGCAYECTWMSDLVPIPNWTALPTLIKGSSKGDGSAYESFLVTWCPLFVTQEKHPNRWNKCKVCKAEFEPTIDNVTCSAECRKTLEKQYEEKRIKKKLSSQFTIMCGYCGKVFVWNTNKKKYCCDGCKEAKKIERKKATTYTFVCKNCGKINEARRKNREYCNAKCNKQHQRKKEEETQDGHNGDNARQKDDSQGRERNGS